MLIWILKKTFGALIGNLPPEQRTVLWNNFTTLLATAAKAAAAGAVSGAINSNK